MNIFVLDTDPVEAAKLHCDSHVVKMILESAQLICTALNVSTGTQIAPYKTTHINHPCSIWVRESYSNFVWLVALMYALEDEWLFRFNKNTRHKSVLALEITFRSKQGLLNTAKTLLPDIDKTPFAQAMPEQYRDKDVVRAYRDYYRFDKQHLCKYTKRNIPEFLLLKGWG